MHDSDAIAILSPSEPALLVGAFFIGFADGTLNTNLIALIGLIFPGERESAGVFVLWNLVQCASCAIAFFYSPYLLLHWQILILILTEIVALVCFTKLDMLTLKTKL